MSVAKCKKCGMEDYLYDSDLCNHCRHTQEKAEAEGAEEAKAEEKPPFDGYEFIAIGPYCWGWGKDAKAACLMAAKHGKPDQGFVVWFAHRMTTRVHGVDGSLTWRKDHPPVRVGHVTPMVRHFVVEGIPIILEGFEAGSRVESEFSCECDGDAFLFTIEDEHAVCARCARKHAIGIRPLSDGEDYGCAYKAEEEEEEEPAV